MGFFAIWQKCEYDTADADYYNDADVDDNVADDYAAATDDTVDAAAADDDDADAAADDDDDDVICSSHWLILKRMQCGSALSRSRTACTVYLATQPSSAPLRRHHTRGLCVSRVLTFWQLVTMF